MNFSDAVRAPETHQQQFRNPLPPLAQRPTCPIPKQHIRNLRFRGKANPCPFHRR